MPLSLSSRLTLPSAPWTHRLWGEVGAIDAMKFRVSAPLVHRVLDERFGGIANFADEWRDPESTEESPDPRGRSMKTIYAWLKNGLPSKHDTLFRFFGAIDVDPMAALDFDQCYQQRTFGRLRRAFMLGGASAGGFRPLFDLYRPSAGWPDSGLSRSYFSRDWTSFDFSHTATDITNTYATITIKGTDSAPVWWPRAFHIAYRRRANADGLWRPFGTVVSREGEAILLHENGDLQQMAIATHGDHEIRFQTYFGPSPAEFRLVSLHPFSGQVQPRPDAATPLRFIG